jgi:N-acetylmuramoyl-L-alanine amidase
VEVRVPGRAPVNLPARLLEGARYVSSLELLRALGVEGEWHPERGELLARVGRMPLRLRAGSRTLEYGGRTFRLARPPRRAGEGLLVPEEFIGPLRAAFIENAPPTVAKLPEWTALRTVIVDPGHGGDDRGAEGPGGVLEKDVTLAVARRLAERLRAELGCRTVLTRTSDRAVSLPERTAVAVRESGDLFLSLHANASPSPSAAGYETFIVSAQASDAEAERLAEIENAAGGQGPSLLPTSFLQQTLQDLIHSESMEESQRLAALVQEYLGAALRGPNRGVKQAPFWVLAGVEMPAVLVELGFMTNLSEGKRLADPAIQSRMAEAIADAVAAFRFELDLRHGVTERSRKAAGE